MFDILMDLPLFRGVSRERMTETVEMARFHFLKYLQEETIIDAGDPCTHIKFIISGRVRSSISSADKRFKVSQTLCAPDVIAPDFLFGRAIKYPCRVTAIDPSGILQISKNDYLKILNSDQIFMFNFLNILSVNAQKSVEGVLSLATESLEERIAFLIVALTQPGGLEISLSCRQRDLYTMLGAQRGAFISSLGSMKERGIIDYDQNEIRVHDRRALIALLHADVENV